jgi:DNA primase
MKLPQEFFSKIRSEVNIVAVIQNFVQLKRRGKDYVGLCPFHSEETPSFTVNVEKRFYHCFGCASHGDVIQFLASSQGMPYKESAIKIANQYGIEVPKISTSSTTEEDLYAQIFKTLDIASKFFQSNLEPIALNYLTQRKIEENLINKFEIGYASGQGKLIRHLEQKSIPISLMEEAGLIAKTTEGRVYEVFRNRVIFPIKNPYGQILGFGGRSIDEQHPKYLNSPETKVFKKSSVLFGEHIAINKGYKTNNMILVEGYLDVVAMHSIGLDQTVAALGTSITDQHLTKIWQHVDELILCLDQDRAGVQATHKVMQMAAEHISTIKQLSVIFLPAGADPDIAINEQKIDLNDLLNKRIPLSESIWNYRSLNCERSSAEEKSQLEKTLSDYANQIKDPILKKNFHQFFKDKLRSKFTKFFKKEENKSVLYQEKQHLPKFSHKTELENIEYCIIASIILNPKLISELKVLEELNRLSFAKKEVEELFSWLLSNAQKHLSDTQSLIQEIQTSGFGNLYNSKISHYCNKESNLKINAFQIDMLFSRHKLEILKTEYLALLQSDATTEDQNAKIAAYQKEIENLTSQINATME